MTYTSKFTTKCLIHSFDNISWYSASEVGFAKACLI